MQISYGQYLDKVWGGWIGKCVGGALGAKDEGNKNWIEFDEDKIWPARIPPNDDLDLQIVWLHVLEQRGPHLIADDLADAWLEYCWYPFSEYGIFRRNWRLGIRHPECGRYGNSYYQTGLGCAIRAEIWGYIFPGSPETAAKYAKLDGSLDHGPQAVEAEMMFAAMASRAFFSNDVRAICEEFVHLLPKGSPTEIMTHAAFRAYDDGVDLREARTRAFLAAGFPDTCDTQPNVPLTFLALLYGKGDFRKTLLSALHLGYDTDCTMATSGALIGQILGAHAIPSEYRERIGDELVTDVTCDRGEWTISALARDTARIGVLFQDACNTGMSITEAPTLEPLPHTAVPQTGFMEITYDGMPAAGPGDEVSVGIKLPAVLPAAAVLRVDTPAGWSVDPAEISVSDPGTVAAFTIKADTDAAREGGHWPKQNIFTATLVSGDGDRLSYDFGIAGAEIWRVLDVSYDPEPSREGRTNPHHFFHHHGVALDKEYLPEPVTDADAAYMRFSDRIGKPAILYAYEHELDVSRLIGLRGEYCVYAQRRFISPVARESHVVIGNTDAFRIWVNGVLMGELDEVQTWAPFNNSYRVKLRKGENDIIVKLLKRTDSLKFTLGLREATHKVDYHNYNDWLIDLADVLP